MPPENTPALVCIAPLCAGDEGSQDINLGHRRIQENWVCRCLQSRSAPPNFRQATGTLMAGLDPSRHPNCCQYPLQHIQPLWPADKLPQKLSTYPIETNAARSSSMHAARLWSRCFLTTSLSAARLHRHLRKLQEHRHCRIAAPGAHKVEWLNAIGFRA